ncbi:hypothetical protein RGQ29_030408 [Quercus rubra]|uniref:Uncharacterized protein n=1 Tax=Quercus rubra TaxID=3512 RepID=A0AAN7IE88_QUERU|nr:hypothetical protein RGQ29_030408 [Quercus rubra]
MLELNFNLRIVQQLGYSIGVIFTMEICKDDPKTLLYTNRNWFIPVDHSSGTTPYMQGAM